MKSHRTQQNGDNQDPKMDLWDARPPRRRTISEPPSSRASTLWRCTESESKSPDRETTSGCFCPEIPYNPTAECGTTSECFWPNILGKIRALYAARHLRLTSSQSGIKTVVCAICCDSELVIPGLQTFCSFASDNLEDAVLLACGHVLGKDRVTTWKDNCKKSGADTWSCPICRADLGPRRCKKHRLVDIVDLTRLDATSKVLRNYQSRIEANEEVSRQCRDCHP